MDDPRRPQRALARRPEDLSGWLAAEPARASLVTFLGRWAEPVYLVGGSVRDALLGRDTMDLDFAVEGSAMALARALSDRVGGALVPLDPERDVARVVVGRGERAEHWDLAGLRAPTLEEDLRARDLTINAIALALWPPHSLVDPTGGRVDLGRGLLRAASGGAFRDDPVRVVRLARFRGELRLPVQPATRRLAIEAAPGLAGASAERLRDELFAILRLDRSASALGYLHRLGGLALTLGLERPADAALELGLTRLKALEGCLPLGRSSELDAVLWQLRDDWGRGLAGGRARWQSVKLAAILGKMTQESAAAACLALRLSTAEVRWVRGAVAGAQALSAGLECIGDLALYRYYRRFGEAGVDGAALALTGDGAPRASEALMAWYRRPAEVVDPPRLVDGRDVMRVLGADSGPAVGRALEAIREAQVARQVVSRDEALRWLERLGDDKDSLR